MPKATTRAVAKGARSKVYVSRDLGSSTTMSVRHAQHPQANENFHLQRCKQTLNSGVAITGFALIPTPRKTSDNSTLGSKGHETAVRAGDNARPDSTALFGLHSMEQNSQRLRRNDAAAYLQSKYGFGTPASSNSLAATRRGPKFTKIGGWVYYTPEDLDAWVASRTKTVDPTATSSNGGNDA